MALIFFTQLLSSPPVQHVEQFARKGIEFVENCMAMARARVKLQFDYEIEILLRVGTIESHQSKKTRKTRMNCILRDFRSNFRKSTDRKAQGCRSDGSKMMNLIKCTRTRIDMWYKYQAKKWLCNRVVLSRCASLLESFFNRQQGWYRYYCTAWKVVTPKGKIKLENDKQFADVMAELIDAQHTKLMAMVDMIEGMDNLDEIAHVYAIICVTVNAVAQLRKRINEQREL
ncbi:MAG: hypothetical protein EZS28_034402 [Streblomastix strix]|uniref:Uncharacterized protein n=1 Tax=Streblomastix strix TaxID=222440 RepID=A0A5J4UJA6_9EUKA|nr:MAG: hypothetical protein EZS28_034402 [Streblomastix strix]